MMGKMRNIPGGHLRAANRWFDAGYAFRAPHAASLIYFFLSRWADNETGIVEQTIGAITRKSGVRSERIVRNHLAGLELWGVISALPRAYQNKPNRWQLNDLEKRAPAYPSDKAIEAYRRGDPAPSEGSNEEYAPALSEGSWRSENGQERVNPRTAPAPSALSPSTPLPTAPAPGDNALGGTPYQANQNQAIRDQAVGDQAMHIIACSGAKAPTHAAQPSADAEPRFDFAKQHATDSERVGVPSSRDFQLWWANYPGDWEEYYQDAWIAWNQLAPNARLAFEIRAAIEDQATWPEYQDPEGLGLPNPAKWLRERRWEDEPQGGWPDEDNCELETWDGHLPF